MPNHIKSRLIINGTIEQVKEILKKYSTNHPAKLNTAHDGSIICKKTGEESTYGWFDIKTGKFTRRNEEPVIGLAEGWEMEINQAYNHFPDFNKIIPQPENIFLGDLGQEEEEMCKREGRPTWYEWNSKNWGTKWNSYSCQEEEYNVFVFETAWRGVPHLIKELSKQNPGIEFYYEYADEDTGNNCGTGKFLNGDMELFMPPSFSKEAYDIAFKLRPEYKEDYILEGDNYVYHEKEEEEEKKAE